VLPYWILLLIPVSLSASRVRLGPTSTGRWSPAWWIVFIVLVCAIGLRHEVGGDWFSYLEHINTAAAQTFVEALSTGDPAYSAVNWIAAQLDLGAYFVNTVCAGIFTWGLLVFCRAQPRPWLALVVAMPYLVTVVAMGYTRQGVAIGFAMLALVALAEQRILRFVVFIALAATFHKSAVILMPLAILASSRKRIWTLAWVGVASILFYGLLLQESVESLQANYIEAEYASSGAAIRIAMNAVPALLFLVFRRRFVMAPADRSFWTWMALGALGFVVLLAVSPSSTAVDRVALYWIPLQLFVFSRLPNALGPPTGRNDLWVCVVVGYSAAVLFTWLSFADHAFAWLPYQFYPWVMLWR
jgi:hypothetical protein